MVAPTIFMMAISSFRLKVASLIVFCIMNTLTIKRMMIRATETMLTMFRTVIKPWAISREALTSAIPCTSRMRRMVSAMRVRSSI